MTVGGATTVTGTTAVTAGAFAGATANLTTTGNTTFTGAVTLTGGAGAGSNATLTLNGASNTFTGGLSLATAGKSILTVASNVAQSITGAITGSGNVVVDNAAGVTFNSAVTAGGITIEKAAGDSAATFKAAVTAPITLGGAGTGTNTVTFDGTTAGFAVTGAIAGASGTETNNIAVVGGNTITLATASTSNLNNLSVTGTGTILATGQNLTVTNTTIGSGAKLSTTANTVTSAVANNGTLSLDGGSVVGAITGTGLLDVNASGTVTGAITQGTADIAAATLTQGAASGYTVGTTNFSGAGTLALLGGSQTVTGNFTNTTDGEGTISITNVAGTTAFVGNLGASAAHSLAALSVAGATAQTVTTTGHLFVDAITVNDADTLQFLGNSAQTVSGTITDGILTVGNGTTTSDVSFGGAISSAATANVSANAIARFGAATSVTGALTNAGNAYVARGATVTAGSYAGAGAYNIEVIDAGTLGTLEVGDFGRLASGGAIDLAAETVNFNVTGNIGTGTMASVFTGGGAAVNALAETDNSYRYNLDLVANGNNFDVVVTRETAAAVGMNTNNDVALTLLDGIENTTNTQLAAAIDNLSAASTRAAANEVIESVLPSVDAGAVSAGFDASVQSLGVTETRLASLRSGVAETGMVAGDVADGLTVWTQGFGKVANQDVRDGVDGYDANTYGLAVGVDTANGLKDATVGVAVSYANTDVESDNSNTTDTDVDSIQLSVYGDYDVTPETYIKGAVAYARNSIDQVRHNVGGVAGLNAAADYDSNQYIVYAEAGHDVALDDSAVLTPKVLAHYQHIAIDGYTETGAGGANLNVGSDDLNVFELGLGAEMAWNLKSENGGKVRPALNVGYRHDLIGDSVETTSNFTGGGASFKTEGVDAAKGTFNVGASLGVQLDNNWEVSADYDYEVKSDYNAHSAHVRAGYKF